MNSAITVEIEISPAIVIRAYRPHLVSSPFPNKVTYSVGLSITVSVRVEVEDLVCCPLVKDNGLWSRAFHTRMELKGLFMLTFIPLKGTNVKCLLRD